MRFVCYLELRCLECLYLGDRNVLSACYELLGASSLYVLYIEVVSIFGGSVIRAVDIIVPK